TDPVSAFGSVIALNREADGVLAEAMADLFVEVLLAPGFSPEARERFGAKKNLRLIECPLYRPHAREIELRALDGGFLAQPPDGFCPCSDGPDGVTRAGVTAIVQPGGSKRDDEVIAAADEAGVAMVFTGVRHFRH